MMWTQWRACRSLPSRCLRMYFVTGGSSADGLEIGMLSEVIVQTTVS